MEAKKNEVYQEKEVEIKYNKDFLSSPSSSSMLKPVSSLSFDSVKYLEPFQEIIVLL